MRKSSIYEISKSQLIENNLLDLLSKPADNKGADKNYVLIIDEINRGNISRIFGELITLVEDDKRIGMENEMFVRLPYSKDSDFGIPRNIFIVGTMNTADRSIALMDVALRRRFSFKRIDPNSKIIVDVLSEKGINEDFIELVKGSFDILNKRVRILIDEDHMIGHSYFLKIGTEDPERDLWLIWYDQSVPLLQEYFYNDWDKLRFVLGIYDKKMKKGFVKSLEGDYKVIIDHEVVDEYPCEIAKYKTDHFSEVLKNTFLS